MATRQDGGDPSPASGRYPQRPALPELAIATRQDGGDPSPASGRYPQRPALPELAIATSGSLDFSSVVYREGPGRQGR
ncbi:hypothetical protein BST29_08300 [Mycobacterium malmoense]|uniref:Uncharacterized protein n=1 Tax=Mycobacterium malmoense TaxID=1780 RepID=A0ABX3SU51_MYCMA|nr:hypothetical protein BST29_08300 [Mycobacterium malmoense]